jgi:anti-sigma B factor antagonist
MMSFSINGNFDFDENRWKYKLKGEIDISNAHSLKEEIESAFANHPADMELDLSELNYIDSTGLGVIISVYGMMKESGSRIVLTNVRDNVKKLLKVTNLEQVLC